MVQLNNPSMATTTHTSSAIDYDYAKYVAQILDGPQDHPDYQDCKDYYMNLPIEHPMAIAIHNELNWLQTVPDPEEILPY